MLQVSAVHFLFTFGIRQLVYEITPINVVSFLHHVYEKEYIYIYIYIYIYTSYPKAVSDWHDKIIIIVVVVVVVVVVKKLRNRFT